MLKVGHVIPSLAPSFGGPSFAAIGMASALARRGHQVHLLTTNRGGETPMADELRQSGVKYMMFNQLIPAWAYSPGLANALDAITPELDLLHIHSLYLHPTVAAALAGQRHRVPYIIRPAGALDPYHFSRKRLKKKLFELAIHNRVLRHAAAIHFTTEIEQQISSPNIFDRPSLVVPNGLDLGLFTAPVASGALRKRYPKIGAAQIVLSLGRINYKKGFEVLIPAFAGLLRRRADVHLVIAGNDDGYLDTVQRLVAQSGIAAAVTFTGFLNGKEKIEAFADSAIFVAPSYAENFANAIFEALAAGLPAIVSNKVNSWPVIAGAGAGVVIAPEASALENAMAELLGDPTARVAMGRRAAAFAHANYGWDAIARKLDAAYASILGREVASP
jgi:glycosyltransferase involved in cell wall biosynthesis